jgi:hypothetical protein
MAGDLRLDQLDAERPEPAERAFLVGLDQPRIAGPIAGKDRREPTFDASVRCTLHGASSVAPCSTRMSSERALSMTGACGAEFVVIRSPGCAEFVVRSGAIRCFLK